VLTWTPPSLICRQPIGRWRTTFKSDFRTTPYLCLKELDKFHRGMRLLLAQMSRQNSERLLWAREPCLQPTDTNHARRLLCPILMTSLQLLSRVPIAINSAYSSHRRITFPSFLSCLSARLARRGVNVPRGAISLNEVGSFIIELTLQFSTSCKDIG
jgi:hypothetical protein